MTETNAPKDRYMRRSGFLVTKYHPGSKQYVGYRFDHETHKWGPTYTWRADETQPPIETRTLALKWVLEDDNGRPAGGVSKTHPYRLTWQKDEQPGQLCGEGYHAFTSFSGLRTWWRRHLNLWLVEVRNPTAPARSDKIAGTNIRFITRLWTGAEFMEADERARANHWHARNTVLNALDPHGVNLTYNVRRGAAAGAADAADRDFWYQTVLDMLNDAGITSQRHRKAVQHILRKD